MLLGFISLLLTVTQESISNICVPKKVGDSWHPCKKDIYSKNKYYDPCLEKVINSCFSSRFMNWLVYWIYMDMVQYLQGKVQLVSAYGIHQLHIFIFVLAVFHVIYCVLTYAFGKLKVDWFRYNIYLFSSSHRYMDIVGYRFGVNYSYINETDEIYIY